MAPGKNLRLHFGRILISVVHPIRCVNELYPMRGSGRSPGIPAIAVAGGELILTLRLAVPIIAGLLGQMALQLIDTAMIGRVGVVPLAAASFAGGVVSVVLVIGFGLAVAVHVLVASAWGGDEREEAYSYMWHGLIIALIYSTMVGLALTVAEGGLYLLGQPTEVVDSCLGYYRWLVWSVVPALLFHNVKSFAESRQQPWLPMAPFLVGFILNIILNWVLIFGNLGAPEYGVAGAGAATFISRVVMFGLMTMLVWRGAPAALRRLSVVLALSTARFRRLLALGLPSAIQILFEVGMFTIATLMMGWISARTLAAHQIALNIASFAFMVPLGLSFAVSIRVGEARGRGAYGRVRVIAWGTVAFSALFMAAYAALVIALRDVLPPLFVDDPETRQITAWLLLAAGLFAVFDGIQITAMGALRGLYDVRVPTAIVFVCYWVISLPVAALCAFRLNFEGFGIWLGMVVGLFCASAFLGTRLYFSLRRYRIS